MSETNASKRATTAPVASEQTAGGPAAGERSSAHRRRDGGARDGRTGGGRTRTGGGRTRPRYGTCDHQTHAADLYGPPEYCDADTHPAAAYCPEHGGPDRAPRDPSRPRPGHPEAACGAREPPKAPWRPRAPRRELSRLPLPRLAGGGPHPGTPRRRRHRPPRASDDRAPGRVGGGAGARGGGGAPRLHLGGRRARGGPCERPPAAHPGAGDTHPGGD